MRAFVVALLVVLLSVAAGARAQPGDDLRAKARQLASVGGELYQKQQYAAALEKLDEAYSILRVPSLGYYSAHCMEKIGRWVEASARYQEVTNLALPERSREIHAKAREDAAKARAALLPRIPRLHIELTVVGADARTDEPSVSLDGRPLAASTRKDPVPVDPGEHRVSAVLGDIRVEEKVTAKPGEKASVTLKLVVPSTPAPAPPSPQPPTPRPAPQPIPPSDDGAIRIAGFVALGIGAAAIVGGAITGGILLSEKSSLDEVCVDEACSAEADVGTYNALRPTTTALLAGGGALAATGLVLVLVFDGAPEEQAVTPLLGPSFVGASIRF
jgi:hypothetical protein